MSFKSLFFLGVIVTTFLLVSHDTAHARELIEAKELNRNNNVEPKIRPGLKDEKWFLRITGGYGRPGYGVGYGGIGGGLQPGIGGGLQPGFGGGLQPGIGGGYVRPGYGFGYGYGVGGINGLGGFRGGNGIPGY